MAKQFQKATKKVIGNKKEAEHISSQTQINPAVDWTAEVTSITAKGIWVRAFSKDYFRKAKLGKKPRDYFLPFTKFPHFLGATEDEIKQVTLVYCDLRWKLLDVAIELAYFDNPRRYPLIMFSNAQLDRLKKYNDEQVAKGGKPWFKKRLLDYAYWRKINNLEQ